MRSLRPSLMTALALCLPLSTAALAQNNGPPPPDDPPPEDGAACAPVEEITEMEARFVDSLFPEDPQSGIACAYHQLDVCQAELTHLSLNPPPQQIADLFDCRVIQNPEASVGACYATARWMTRQALDQGNAAMLHEALVRTGDLIRRAQVEPGTPLWITEADNLMVQLFASVGLDPLQAPDACVSGPQADRYACFADHPLMTTEHVRALLTLGDRHLGHLARAGLWTEARQGSLKWYKAATAPVFEQMARTGQLDQNLKPGIQRVDLLGKYYALRLLDGSALTAAQAPDPQSETAHLIELPGYVPPSAANHPGWKARLGVVLAQQAAFEYAEAYGAPRLEHATLAEDLWHLYALIEGAALTARNRGQCAVRDRYLRLWMSMVSTHIVPGLQAIMRDSVPLDPQLWQKLDGIFRNSTIDKLFGSGDGTGDGLCGWVRYDTVMVSISSSGSNVSSVGMDDCEVGANYGSGTIIDCWECRQHMEWDCGLFGWRTCEQTFTYADCLAESGGEDWLGTVYTRERTRAIEQYNAYSSSNQDIIQGALGIGSIRETYRLGVLNNYRYQDEGAWYGGGAMPWFPDMDHLDADETTATVANARVKASTCFGEVDPDGNVYGVEEQASLNCEEGDDLDENCGYKQADTFAANTTTSFIPYAIAARICPDYVATIVGALDNDDGECITPWEYTQAVADFVDNADALISRVYEANDPEWYWSPVDEESVWNTEEDETVKTVLIDFTHELLILATPAMGVYQKLSTLASVAGELPELAVVEGDTADEANLKASAFNTNYGLDLAETRLNYAHYIAGRAIEQFLEFDALDEPGETSMGLPLVGDLILPRLALESISEVSNSSCDDNRPVCGRAQLYQRLGDFVEVYDKVVSDRVELYWRLSDGAYACVDETGVCAEADDCVDVCGAYNQALAEITEAQGHLTNLQAVLDKHIAWFGYWARESCTGPGGMTLLFCVEDPEGLEDFVNELGDYVSDLQTRLTARAAAIESGIDWLGFKPGLQYAGDDPDTQMSELISDIYTLASGSDYSDLIAGYLSLIQQESAFRDVLFDSADAAESNLAHYCACPVSESDVSDECYGQAHGAPAPSSCAVDETPLSTHDLVSQVNTYLQNYLCDLTVEIYGTEYGVGSTFMEDWSGDDPDLEDAFEDFQDFMADAGDGVEDRDGDGDADCPVLVSPDFDQWDDHGGLLASDLDTIELYLTRLKEQLFMLGQQAALLGFSIEEYLSAQDASERAAKREKTLAVVKTYSSCIVMFAAAAGLTAASQGAAAPSIKKAFTRCYAGIFETHSALTSASAEEAYQAMSFEGQFYGNLSALNGEMVQVMETLLLYEDAIENYNSHRGALAQLEAQLDRNFRRSYENAFAFDPTNQMFADEQLRQVRHEFDTMARRIRELEKVVQYDTGFELTGGQTWISSDGYSTFYLPRLAELSVYGPYGVDASDLLVGATALTDVAEGSIDPRDLSLVNLAAMLIEMHGLFKDTFGDRSTQTAQGWIVDGYDADNPDLFNADGVPNNPGEWAMLRRSPFYDPDTPHGECDAGYVDAQIYCPSVSFADPCIEVATTFETYERVNLAWLDHMIRGSNNTFSCVYEDTDDDGVGDLLTIQSAAGSDWLSTFSKADLDYEDALSDGYSWLWDNRTSQTEVVQSLLNEVEVLLQEQATVSTSTLTRENLELYPGGYLITLDLDAGWVESHPTRLDIERDLMNRMGSANTMVEQIENIGILCTNSQACGGEAYGSENTPAFNYAWLAMAGPLYQSGLCADPASSDDSRQLQERFEMDQGVVLSGYGLTLNASFGNNQESALGDLFAASAETDGASVSLHPNRMFMGIHGFGEVSGTSHQWSLHSSNGTDTSPRIRLGVEYSYYSTIASGDASSVNFASYLTCPE